jgi:hypothetical protein
MSTNYSKYCLFLIPITYNRNVGLKNGYPSSDCSTDEGNMCSMDLTTCSLDYTESTALGSMSIEFHLNHAHRPQWFLIDNLLAADEKNKDYSIQFHSGSIVINFGNELYSCSFGQGISNLSFNIVTGSLNNCDLYSVRNVVYSDNNILPMYNQGSSIEYSYPALAFEGESLSEKMFPQYNVAYKTKLCKEISLEWQGLRDEEVVTVKNMIKLFGVSYRPFYLLEWSSSTEYVKRLMVIKGDNISLTKDRFNIYNFSFTALEFILDY